ncbi:MAG: tetratricopeptide repeat protein [Planctomycetota bacterium]
MSREFDPPTQLDPEDDGNRSTGEELHDLFARCLERFEVEGPSAIEAFCDENPEHATAIRRWVDNLKRIGLLEAPKATDQIPERLGDFRLLERLGGGGMGAVFLAEQESLGRQVALKVIRPELLYFSGARERFRREVEAVARLQHPGIVPVHSVGEQDGIPYFVMERVEGRTLAEVLESLAGRDPSELTGADLAEAVSLDSGEDSEARGSQGYVFSGTWVEACFRLVRQTADALEHAHQRGVVHRDIKPSNIMVTPAGRVMLLDFGLASQAGGATRLTRTGSQVGSLPYMSPEHLRNERDSLDRRTDVYSLGVTLYELLTLTSPYHLPTEESAKEAILAGRRAPIRQINASVPWDAEVVCHTAMEPDRDRRYATAADLGRDLDNVLEHRPIEARRPGLWLLSKRWVQRNPTRSLAALLALVVVVIAPSIIAWQATESERALRVERNRVVSANEELGRQRDAALEAELEARTQWERAETESERALVEQRRAEEHLERALQALDQLLVRLSSSSLSGVPHMERIRREVLEDAIPLFEGFLDSESDQPSVVRQSARAYSRLGSIQELLGDLEKADQAFVRAIEILRTLPEGSEGYAKTLSALANVLNERGSFQARNQLSDEVALECFEAALELKRGLVEESPDDPKLQLDFANTSLNRASFLMNQGRIEECERMLRESISRIEAIDDLPDEIRVRARVTLANGKQNLGATFLTRQRYPEAVEHLTEAMALRRELVDEDSTPDRQYELAMSCYNLGSTHFRMQKPEEGAAHYAETLEILERLETDFPATFTYPDFRSKVFVEWSRFSAALGQQPRTEELLERAIAIREKLTRRFPERGEVGVRLGEDLFNLAISRHFSGQDAKVTPLYERAIEVLEDLEVDDQDRDTLLRASYLNLGVVYHNNGQTEKALASYEKGLEIAEALVAKSPENLFHLKNLITLLNNLGLSYRADSPEKSEPYLRRSLEIARRMTELDSKDVGNLDGLATALDLLGGLQRQLEHFEEAESMLRESWDLRAKLKAMNPGSPEALYHFSGISHNLAFLLRKTGRSEEAEPLLEDGLRAIRGALRINAKHPYYLDFLSISLELQSEVRLDLGNITGAAESAIELSTVMEGGPDDLKDAAVLLAACCEAIRADASLRLEERERHLDEWSRRAVEILRTAAQRGFRDLSVLEGDALAVLASRDDFQQLLLEIRGDL